MPSRNRKSRRRKSSRRPQSLDEFVELPPGEEPLAKLGDAPDHGRDASRREARRAQGVGRSPGSETKENKHSGSSTRSWNDYDESCAPGDFPPLGEVWICNE